MPWRRPMSLKLASAQAAPACVQLAHNVPLSILLLLLAGTVLADEGIPMCGLSKVRWRSWHWCVGLQLSRLVGATGENYIGINTTTTTTLAARARTAQAGLPYHRQHGRHVVHVAREQLASPGGIPSASSSSPLHDGLRPVLLGRRPSCGGHSSSSPIHLRVVGHVVVQARPVARPRASSSRSCA